MINAKKDLKEILLNKFEISKKFQFNEYLFREGAPFKGVYYILEGRVKIIRGGSQMKMAMWFAEKGELVGVTSLFGNTNAYAFSAIVPDGYCKALYITEQQFNGLLREYPEFKKELIKTLCNRINYTEKRIKSFKQHSTKRRFIDALLFFAERDKNGNNQVRINYSVKDFSEIIGSTRQYIQKLLQEFQRENLLKIENRSVLIYDISKLEA